MPLDDQTISEKIEQDHHKIYATIDQIKTALHSNAYKDNFAVWKLELRRLLLTFHTMLLLHFELESESGFNHTSFLSDADKLKTIHALKAEHGEFLNIISEIAILQKEMQARDDLRQQLLINRFGQLVKSIEEHERKESQLISNTIKEFKETGRYNQEPTHTADEVALWERDLKYSFPDSWKRAVIAGSYDKLTFHFVPPYRDKENSRYVVFAEWNDVMFGFDSEVDANEESPVYILLDGMNPEKKYDDFNTWFQLVFEMANQPVSAG